MTTTTSVNKFRYEGNGSTDTFAFTGRIFAESDLVVEIITRATDALEETLTITTDYTVTINNDESASVVTVAGKIPSATQDIQIRRSLAKTQTVDLPVGTVFPAESVEDALDRNVSIIQDQAEEIARAIKLPVTSSLSDIELPNAVASEVIGWNSGATALTTYSFAEISTALDTVFTGLASGDYLQYNGTNWVNKTNAEIKTDLGLKQNNYAATAAPTTGDDSDDGYSIGSQWYDGTNDNMYHCMDATVGAAVWVQGDIVAADLGSAAVATLIDDDTFATATASNIPSAESVKAYVDGEVSGVVFTESFTSSEQTITVAGSLTVAHGLSSAPELVQCRLICKTAELGYSVDDELIISHNVNGDGSVGHSIVPDATNLNVRYGGSTGAYEIVRKDTGIVTAITVGNWRLVLKAWA